MDGMGKEPVFDWALLDQTEVNHERMYEKQQQQLKAPFLSLNSQLLRITRQQLRSPTQSDTIIRQHIHLAITIPQRIPTEQLRIRWGRFNPPSSITKRKNNNNNMKHRRITVLYLISGDCQAHKRRVDGHDSGTRWDWYWFVAAVVAVISKDCAALVTVNVVRNGSLSLFLQMTLGHCYQLLLRIILLLLQLLQPSYLSLFMLLSFYYLYCIFLYSPTNPPPFFT